MPFRSNRGPAALLAGAILLSAGAGHAETPDELLQEAAKLRPYCKAPTSSWGKKKVSSNYDSCGDEVKALMQAIELSKKDPKILTAASPQLLDAKMNLAWSAPYIGRVYTEQESREAALGFLQVACTPLDDVSSFAKPTPEQVAAAKSLSGQANQALQGFQRSRKTVGASE